MIELMLFGRLLGTHMGAVEASDTEVTYLAFQPAPGVTLPQLTDLVVDFEGGWVTPIRGEGGGEAVDGSIDLVELLHSIPRT